MTLRFAALRLAAAGALAVAATLAMSGAAAAQAVPAHGPSAAAPPRDQVLVMGRVARRASSHQPRLEAMADWLASRLAGVGIRAGAGLVVRTMPEMVTALKEGRVDIVSESILPALAYEDRVGAEIFMLEWRDGLAFYHGVFITRRDSPILALGDLAGKRIAFEDRGSTTGFALPMAALRAAGLKPIELNDVADPVPAGHVGYVFALSEANIAAWTADGRVDAGAYSNRDWERRRATPKRYRQMMRIFHSTNPLPRSVLVLRPGLPAARRAALVAAFKEYNVSGQLVALRKTYYDVDQFAAVDAATDKTIGAARALYRDLRALMDW